MNEPKVRITMRHSENTQAIENHLNKQLARVIGFISHEPTPIFIDCVITPAKVHANNEVSLHVKSPNFEAIVKKEGPEVYTLIDTVCEEAFEKLVELKRKLDADHKQGRMTDKNQLDGEYSRKQRTPKK